MGVNGANRLENGKEGGNWHNEMKRAEIGKRNKRKWANGNGKRESLWWMVATRSAKLCNFVRATKEGMNEWK